MKLVVTFTITDVSRSAQAIFKSNVSYDLKSVLLPNLNQIKLTLKVRVL